MDENNISVVEETTEGVAEPQSQTEVPAEGASEEPATPEIPNEVWKTARLKAEKEAGEKAQAKIDAFYENVYGGYGIHSEEDYRKYMADKETSERDGRLSEAGFSKEDILGVIKDMPEMETLRKYKEAEEARFQEEALDYCVKEIAKLDPSIKSFEDLMNAPNSETFNTLVEKGYSLKDAYMLANFDALAAKRASEAQQSTIKKISQNRAASPGSLTGAPEPQKVDFDKLTGEEFEAYVQKAMRGELSHN